MKASLYTASLEDAWDNLVAASTAGTFLHTRRFLSYHGERFADASVLFFDKKNTLCAVIPAARSLTNDDVVISHPGITFGGLLHTGWLRGERNEEAFHCARDVWVGLGYKALQYKAIPRIYHRCPSDDDLYSLFRMGAQRIRCDLSSVIDLSHRLPLSERRLRASKKAKKNGILVRSGICYINDLWDILRENLERRHEATPVHTAAEILMLHERFPQEIDVVVGTLNGQVVAGVVLFRQSRVTHAQYIASNRFGNDSNALDAVFEQVIEQAMQRNDRYFSFGSSTEQDGRVLNSGLYGFKSEFGAGGQALEFYRLDLEKHPQGTPREETPPEMQSSSPQ